MSGRPGYKIGRIRIGMEAAILSAAEREFAERGFSGASILRIAERAGISRTNVHYYYQSKEELYRRVLTRIVEMWNDSFPEITPKMIRHRPWRRIYGPNWPFPAAIHKPRRYSPVKCYAARPC